MPHARTLAGILAVAPGAAAQIPLQPIGALAPPHIQSTAVGVSADGSTVFGVSSSTTPGDFQAVKWTAQGGLQSLGTLGGTFSYATAASADGSVIVGASMNAAGNSIAFRWTSQTGMQSLGMLTGYTYSEGTAVTPDGSVICGYAGDSSSAAAFRWTSSGGLQDLGPNVRAIAISADGNTILCRGGSAGALWTPAAGLQPLPFMTTPPWFPTFIAEPSWLSPDGFTIIGTARDMTGDWNIGYRYRAATGYTGFQSGAMPWWHAIVDGVSPDERIKFGGSFFSQEQYTLIDGAVEQTSRGYLVSRGADLTGWVEVFIRGISLDQRTVVGNGLRSSLSEGWVVTLPAPCYPNCDHSSAQPMLTANDFQCFINRFAAQDPYANCDGSIVHPVLTANDFQCYLNAYAGGCS